jgi:FkbM family methyltransferase
MKESTSVAQILRCLREFGNKELRIQNIVEIGAFDATDAAALANEYGTPYNQVIVVEPNPANHQKIKARFPGMWLIKKAIGNCGGTVPFFSYRVEGPYAEGALASSSTQRRTDQPEFLKNPEICEVPAITGRELFEHCRLAHISILKIDVEGTAYEVLEGFGDMLKQVRVIQIETDTSPICEGQTKLHDHVAELLLGYGFVCYEVRRHWDTMLDSLWLNDDCCEKNKIPQTVRI